MQVSNSYLLKQLHRDGFRDLVLDNDHISRMEKGLREAIEKGLDKKTHETATVKCFPTYVRELPSGYEVSFNCDDIILGLNL